MTFSTPSLPSPSPPVAVTRDARLARARRIDWRLLLDRPELGRVALAGRSDHLLRDAICDTLAGDGRLAAFDGPDGELRTVVLSGRFDRDDLTAATRRLAPDGRLVIETDGLMSVASSRHGRPSATAATRLRRILRGGGFEVRSWIAWPAIDRPIAMVDLDDPVGLRLLAERRVGAGGRRWAGRLVGRLAGHGLLAAAAPGVVLIAMRQAGPTFAERRLSVSGGGLLILTPRYRASAHVVGLALADDGTVARVAKMARLPDDRGLLREAAALRALATAGAPPWVGPTILDEPDLGPMSHGRTAVQTSALAATGEATREDREPAWPVLVESAIDGSPLDPAAVRRDRATAIDAMVAWLEELPVREPDQRVTSVSARLDGALAVLEPLADDSPAGHVLADLLIRTRRAIGPLRDVALPVAFEHGDPAHPNLIRRPDGRVTAVDWERAEPDGLPLHDATIAVAYLASAIADAYRPDARAAAFRAAMSGDDPWAATVLDRAARRLSLGHALRPALVVATWLRTSAWLATELRGDDAGSGGAGRARASGTVDAGDTAVRDWLLTDRATSLWRVALDLAEADR